MDLIILLWNLVFTISKFNGSNSQTTEKASLSTPPTKLHKDSVSNLGNISVLWFTKYTVVHLYWASKSIGVSGRTK